MRFILIALAALTFAAPARADVFVPADPPPTDFGDCGDSVGGVEFIGSPAPRGWRVRVRSAGGAWGTAVRLAECPALTVGQDGWAALWTRTELFVRPPGGALRPRAKAGIYGQVAVGTNGWIAALVVGWRGYDVLTLGALTIAPDGTVRRAGLAMGNLVPGAIGIAGDGTATAAWIDGDAIRTARATAGGAWQQAPPIATVDHLRGQDVGLAVSAAGRWVLTWVDDGAVRASSDGGPAEDVADATTPFSPRPLVDDAGRALIAFAARGGQVVVADRAAGTWSAPREIQGAARTVDADPDDPSITLLRVMSAADGRVVVTWPTTSAIAAAAGRLGGAWSPAQTLSSPVRYVEDFNVDLAPGGAPRVTWTERDDRREAVRRAAVLMGDAAAPPADRTAPTLTATLPVRAPATRAGRLRVRVPVRCSEACDVRLEVGTWRTSRSLPAGKRVVLVQVVDGLDAHPGNRRFHIRVTASDRAGNVATASSTLRVRVIRRPLRSFKVPPSHDFATCTPGGNRRLGRLVNSIVDGLADSSLDSAGAIGVPGAAASTRSSVTSRTSASTTPTSATTSTRSWIRP